MTNDELILMIKDLHKDIAAIRLDITLLSYDIAKIKDHIDKTPAIPQESIGIAPNTPPPDFLPPERM